MPEGNLYTQARIDRAAIAHNCRALRSVIPAECRMCVAAKCNAYGHGVEVVLPVFEAEKIEMLCVASFAEAEELLALNWTGEILVLGSELSACGGGDKVELARWIVENEIRMTLTRKADARELIAAAESLGKQALIHLMLDSGMCRMGLNDEELLRLIMVLRDNPALRIEGLYTHFATANEQNSGYAQLQLRRFTDFIAELTKLGLDVPVIHAANSSATMDMPESRFTMIRPGLSVYGYRLSLSMHDELALIPSMKVVSFLTLIKRIPRGSLIGYGCTYEAGTDMTIGVVPIGYGDGYDRKLSNTGVMTVAGRYAPVVGRVSMDLTIVDLTSAVGDGVEIRVGQEVTVIDNVRDKPNSVESLARQLETIPYEITTRLTGRIKRVAA